MHVCRAHCQPRPETYTPSPTSYHHDCRTHHRSPTLNHHNCPPLDPATTTTQPPQLPNLNHPQLPTPPPTHQVENGDLNWILPGKLVAFSGPAVRPTDYVGFRAMVPEDYWDYYRRRRVTAIVRLNKKVREGGQGGKGERR